MFKTTPKNEDYQLVPPPYEAESSRPFLSDEEENIAEDLFKETVTNSSVEIRMRM